MAGICGVVRFDGDSVEPAALDRMCRAAAFRGPDGVDTWIGETVGLAHLASYTTPESAGERQPLTLDGYERVIAADARLDNRHQLIDALIQVGIPVDSNRGDAGLILAAYSAWGVDCVAQLVGDFAFAIWDRRAHQLFCARDPFGVRPLFYHLQDDLLLFGSTARQLLAHGALAPRLYEPAIAYYLTGKPVDFLTTGTFFTGIRRVRPAHWLRVGRCGELVEGRYWQVDPADEHRCPDDQAYADHLRQLLEQAVAAMARSRGPLALFTSGGMDSSTIAALLEQLRRRDSGLDFRLITLTYGPDHPADERHYVDTLATRWGVAVSYLPALEHLPLSDPSAATTLDEPPRYWNNPVWHAAYAHAAQLGCRVALVGQGGDSLFTAQQLLVGTLLRQGRYRDLLAEIGAFPGSRAFFLRHLCAEAVRALIPPALLQRWTTPVRPRQLPWVSQDLCQAAVADLPTYPWGFPDYGSQFAHHAARVYNISDWLYPVEAAIQEQAALHGVEIRDPYLDRRLVEFAMGLPVEQLYRRGVTKWILRRASSGILSDSLRLRSSQTTFDAVLLQGLATWLRSALRPQTANWLSVQRGYVVAEVLERAFTLYLTAPTYQMAVRLSRPILLEQWLRSGNHTLLR